MTQEYNKLYEELKTIFDNKKEQAKYLKDYLAKHDDSKRLGTKQLKKVNKELHIWEVIVDYLKSKETPDFLTTGERLRIFKKIKSRTNISVVSLECQVNHAESYNNIKVLKGVKAYIS